MKPQDFIAAIAPAAQMSAARTRIPASFTVAHAALESSWGASDSARLGFNLFGIKADASWKGPTFTSPTTEYVAGKRVTVLARWRQYNSWFASIEDHARFLLGNPRYKPAFAYTDGPSFARAVAEAGYATDPQYATKLVATIAGRRLTQFDEPVISS